MKEYLKIAIVALIVVIIYQKFLKNMPVIGSNFEGDSADDADELDYFED